MEPRALVLEQLVGRRDRWVRLARRWSPGEADAEELVDATLARMVTSGPPEGVLPDRWFARALRNAAIDRTRRRAAEARAHAALGREPVEHAEERTSVCQCVHALTGTLKAEYAEAIHGVYPDGKTPAEWAAEVGLTLNNAGVRLHRARKQLGDRVRAHCGTCADDGCRDCDCAERAAVKRPGVSPETALR